MKGCVQLASSLLVALVVVACSQTPEETADLAVTGNVGPRLGSPVTGDYNRGEKLMSRTFNKSTGVGPIFNESGCKWCHARGGLGGAGNGSRLVNRIAAIDAGSDGVLDAGDLRNASGYHELAELGGPLLHRRSLGEKDRLPTQAEVTRLLGNRFRLIRSSRVGNPVAGSGLLSAIPNAQIEAYAAWQEQDAFAKALGIEGRVAHLGDGFIGRLGWKANVTDTMSFVAGATFNEVGLAHARNMMENVANAAPVRVPAGEEDLSDRQFLDLLAFNNFVAPPKPERTLRAGRAAFDKAGCAVCHAANVYTTGTGNAVPLIPTAGDIYSGDADLYRRETGLHGKKVSAYSDLLLHEMGAFLADGFAQGAAAGDEWKTTPLWGLRYKNAYLHDGRTNDLEQAIRMHAGRSGSDRSSEAYRTVQNYLGGVGAVPGHKLNAQERKELLRFLDSL